MRGIKNTSAKVKHVSAQQAGCSISEWQPACKNAPRKQRGEKRRNKSLPSAASWRDSSRIHPWSCNGGWGGGKNNKKQKTWTVNTSPAAATPSKIQPQAIKQNCVDDGRRQSGTSGQSEEGQSAPSANGRAAKLLDKFGALKREGEGGEGTPSMYCRILEQFREIIVINNDLSSTQFTGCIVESSAVKCVLGKPCWRLMSSSGSPVIKIEIEKKDLKINQITQIVMLPIFPTLIHSRNQVHVMSSSQSMLPLEHCESIVPPLGHSATLQQSPCKSLQWKGMP